MGQLLDWLHEQRDAEPVVVALDMNAAPTRSERGSVSYDPQAYPAALSHPKLRLGSAYKAVLGREPSYTTWKRRGSVELKHCIDYVLHTEHLGVGRVLLPPDERELGEGRLPDWRYPSDHVALAVEFRCPRE